MKLLIINSVLGYGSTGKIVVDIAREYEKKGYEVKIAYGRMGNDSEDAKRYGVRIESDLGVRLHGLYTRLTDKHALGSVWATKKFLKWADQFDPDELWLHNLHGYYINYELLFNWIKTRPQMKVRWTLHDCWAFTGHCSHFTYVKCNRWMMDSFSAGNSACEGCHDCPQIDQYPKALADYSKNNFLRKKAAFTGVQDMTIITPSHWLGELVKKSFLGEYNVEVVHNTINRSVFCPIANTFKKDHNIQGKTMILGVANVWEKRKGIDDYLELSQKLDESCVVVLVGLSQKQISDINQKYANIIALPKTNSAKELAKIYTAADVFVNLTYEDNYPTVNLEAEACGTPVITYDTGGCKETIRRSDSKVIPYGVDNVAEYIHEFRTES